MKHTESIVSSQWVIETQIADTSINVGLACGMLSTGCGSANIVSDYRVGGIDRKFLYPEQVILSLSECSKYPAEIVGEICYD